MVRGERYWYPVYANVRRRPFLVEKNYVDGP